MPFHLFSESTRTTRREFLSGVIAAGAAASLGTARASEETSGYLALLSDTHIAEDPATISRDYAMAENLKAVIAQILEQKEAPLGLFIDGDLALKDGQSGDYKTLVQLLAPIQKAKLPIHLTLGNHDDRDHFREVLKGSIPVETKFEEKHVGIIDALGVRMLLLDTLDEVNVTPGELGVKQTEWLTKELDAKPETPTILFFHHNLQAAGEAGLTDDEALLAVINKRKQVKAVIFGHTHVWDVRKNDQGIYLINLPAIGYPFAATQPIGWTKLRPKDGGAELELFAIGGNKSKNGEKVALTWR